MPEIILQWGGARYSMNTQFKWVADAEDPRAVPWFAEYLQEKTDEALDDYHPADGTLYGLIVTTIQAEMKNVTTVFVNEETSTEAKKVH